MHDILQRRADAVEFQQTIIFAHEHNLPICLLGQGANILISDEGFDGVIVKPALNDITHIPCDDNIGTRYCTNQRNYGCTYRIIV